MNIKELCQLAADKGASDLHFVVGLPTMMRINGRLEKIGTQINRGVTSRSQFVRVGMTSITAPFSVTAPD